jgi:hypothetical protein
MTSRQSVLWVSAVSIAAAACSDGSFPTAPFEALLSSSPVAPTVSTDKDDYAPGEVVTITGSGWTGDVTVRLELRETPEVHGTRTWEVQVDTGGSFVDSSFTPELHHIGVEFTLTAVGSQTGRSATAVFTDGTVGGAAIVFKDGTCTTDQSSFVAGTTACAHGTFTITGPGATNVLLQWLDPSNVVVDSDGIGFGNGVTGARSITSTYAIPAGAVPGIWSARVCQNNCSSAANIKVTTPFRVTAPPAAQTIDFPVVSGKTYGDAPFTLEATASSGLPVSYASSTDEVCSVSGDQVTIVAAGTCTVQASQGGDGVEWAAATSVGQDIAISRAPLTVDADDKSKEYDGEPFTAFTVSYEGFVLGEGPGDLGGAIGFGGAAVGAVDAGTYGITTSGLTSSNYEISFEDGVLTIETRKVSVAADPQTKAEGAPDPTPLTYQITSGTVLPGGGFSGALAREPGEAPGAYPILRGTLTLGPNYDLGFTESTFTITVAPSEPEQEPVSLYLHNDPTPPTKNTSARANLPLDGVAPTATRLYNYATNLDSNSGVKGRFIDKAPASEEQTITDLQKYQSWRTESLATDLAVNGPVELRIWAKMKAPGKNIRLRAFLRECTGTSESSCTTFATLDMSALTNASSTAFTELTLTADGVSRTIDAGNRLQLRVVMRDVANADPAYLAYDTADFLARLILP